MPIKITNIENPQQIEAVVNGPDGANRLFIVTGIAPANVSIFNGTRTDTFTFLIGPTLTRRQFVRAIATASLVKSLYLPTLHHRQSMVFGSLILLMLTGMMNLGK